jgi:hypothetical protein
MESGSQIRFIGVRQMAILIFEFEVCPSVSFVLSHFD